MANFRQEIIDNTNRIAGDAFGPGEHKVWPARVTDNMGAAVLTMASVVPPVYSLRFVEQGGDGLMRVEEYRYGPDGQIDTIARALVGIETVLEPGASTENVFSTALQSATDNPPTLGGYTNLVAVLNQGPTAAAVIGPERRG